MKILFSPQVREKEGLIYTFKDDVIEIEYEGVTDIFDFTSFGVGKLEVYTDEQKNLIETSLEEAPIVSAERKADGILYVELVHHIGFNATEAENFPVWIDHTDYVAPVFEEKEADIVKEEAVVVEEEVAVEPEVIPEEGAVDDIIIEGLSSEVEGWDDY